MPAPNSGPSLLFHCNEGIPKGDGTYHPTPEEFVQLVLAVIQSKGIQERVIIQSFDLRTLEVVHRMQLALCTALLVKNESELGQNLQRLSFQATIYSPAYQLVTPALVQAYHQQHMQVIAWTVNSAAAVEQLVQQGVDGIITDYPDLFGGNSRRPVNPP